MLSACLRSSRLILGDIDPGNRQQRHGGADVSDLAALSEATVGSGVTTESLMLVVRDFDGANWKDDATPRSARSIRAIRVCHIREIKSTMRRLRRQMHSLHRKDIRHAATFVS